MSLNISFTKAVIRSFDRQATGGSIAVTAALTKSVVKAMDWGDFPEWEESSKPKGKLVASVVEFIPNSDASVANIGKFQFELTGAGAVRDFEIVRKAIRDGKNAKKAPKYRVELRFKVDFTDGNGARKMEPYIQAVTESTLKVTYEKEAEQSEIELDDERQKDTGKESD